MTASENVPMGCVGTVNETIYGSIESAIRHCRRLVDVDGVPRSVWLIRGASGGGLTIANRWVIREGIGNEARPCSCALEVQRERAEVQP